MSFVDPHPVSLRMALCTITAVLCLAGIARAAEPSPQVLEAISQGVRNLIDDQDAVGAEVLILKNRKVVLHEVFGFSDLTTRRPLTRNTIACVRSMTKPVVGTAIQMLIDEGKLALSDRASKYLPAFDNNKSRAITVEQLLTHTSGFPLTLIDKQLSSYTGQRAVADQAGQKGPTGKPGVFVYSDSDSETLAAIVAQISGQPAEEFIRRRILEPLGMHDTFCVLSKDSPPRARVSSNHAGSPGLWHKYWDHQEAPFFPFFLGAAALYSTPADYAKFLALWMDHGQTGGQRLLSEEAIQRGLKPALPMLALGAKTPYPNGLPGMQLFYGQHWMVYEGAAKHTGPALPIFGHDGSDGTTAIAFPEQDLIALYFTQSRGGMSVFRFQELLAPLAGLPAPPVRTRLPVEKLRSFVGCYLDDKQHPAVWVQLCGKRMQLEFPDQGALLPLWPDARGRWDFGESVPGTSVSFEFDASGTATAMQVWAKDKQLVTYQRARPSKDWPTVEQLMALRRDKQGGNKVDELKNLELKGKLSVGPTQLDFSFLAAGPEQMVRRLSLPGRTETLIVDHARAVKQEPGQPPEELTGLFFDQAARRNPLARLGDWRKTFTTVEVAGKDQLDKEDVWIVRCAGGSQPPVTRYVSAKSGLLIEENDWITVKGIGTIPLSILFEDYRDVAGVKLPFRTTTESGVTGKQVMRVTEVKANPAIPPDAFSMPAK